MDGIVIEKFKEFKEKENEIWKDHFTWKGLTGKTPKYSIAFYKFFKETHILNTIEKEYNINKIFDFVEKLANRYVDWVKSIEPSYTEKEYTSMHNDFIGKIGEFIFVNMLNEVGGFTIYNPKTDKLDRYDFHYVAPMLTYDKDYGVDLTGICDNVPCVFQIKFWNPHISDNKIGIEIFQKEDSIGIRNHYINIDDNNNLILCWLDSEEKGMRNIKDIKEYEGKVLVIGKKTLEFSVTNKNRIFWDNLYESLKNIG